MLKAVIFDIDGTLVDSVESHARAWQQAFQQFGKKVSLEEVLKQVGKGSDQLLPVFFSSEQLERFGKEMEDFREDLFKREFRPKVRPFRVSANCYCASTRMAAKSRWRHQAGVQT